MRTISIPEGTFFSRCCANVTPANPPPTTMTLRSFTFDLRLSLAFAQSFFKFGLCRPITEQRLLELVTGFGEGSLRFQNIGHERCREFELVGIDAQILAGRLFRQLSNDKSLPGLLEFAELVAYINEDAVFCLPQAISCHLNGLVLCCQLVPLSTPVEDLPLQREASTRQVSWEEILKTLKVYIEEAGTHVRDILGLFDTAVDFSLLDLELRLSNFGPLLERTVPCALQVVRKTFHVRG